MSWESLWRNACCYGMKLELCEYLLWRVKHQNQNKSFAASQLTNGNVSRVTGLLHLQINAKLARSPLLTYNNWGIHPFCIEVGIMKIKKNKTCNFESLPSNSTASNQGNLTFSQGDQVGKFLIHHHIVTRNLGWCFAVATYGHDRWPKNDPNKTLKGSQALSNCLF